ncbi:MAG: hypothetical protein ACFBQW_06165 [Sphingomonadaceae bacterium]
MEDPRDPKENLGQRAVDEMKGMARQGLDHPSTKPVLAGMAIGGVAGALLPVVTLPIGLVAGGGIALWRRIKR